MHYRDRPLHKVVLTTEHMRSHEDYDCWCYSHQTLCYICSVNRALNDTTINAKFQYNELEGENQLTITDKDGNETIYRTTHDLDTYLSEFERRGLGYWRPRQSVLLIMPNKTVDIRQFEND